MFLAFFYLPSIFLYSLLPIYYTQQLILESPASNGGKMWEDDALLNAASNAKAIGGLELINIYPNPARERIEIHLPESSDFTIQIKDTNSRLIRELSGNQQKTASIETNGINSGIYLLRFLQKMAI